MGKALLQHKIENLVTLLNTYFFSTLIFLWNGNSFSIGLEYIFVCTLPLTNNKYWFYYFIIFYC